MQTVMEYGFSEQFKVFGVAPHADLIAIIQNSVALSNPSLFEGWSTTLEESKLLGKTILLSDIGMHIEQSPGVYFDPHCAQGLALSLEREARFGEGDTAQILISSIAPDWILQNDTSRLCWKQLGMFEPTQDG